MSAAARLVTGIPRFDRRLSRLLHDDLHWFDVPERIQIQERRRSAPLSAL